MTPRDADLAKQLPWLARAARWKLGGLLAPAGWAPSGEGAAVVESRDYAPGDDYRAIDWNICARHDELVVRRPPADANRRLYLLVDCSRSMSLGRPPNFKAARQVAAVLGTAALGHLDQLAVLTFAERILAEFPLARGSAHRIRLLRFLEHLGPEGSLTDLARAAACLVRRQPPGTAIVIGDFLAPENYRKGLDILRHHGYVVGVAHVCDQEDAEPNVLGDVELCDIETGQRWSTSVSRRELARYRLVYEQFCGSVRTFCRQRRIRYLRVHEDVSWRRIVFDATGLRLGSAAMDRRIGFERPGRQAAVGARESGDPSPHAEGRESRCS